jgi:hypothetical protein
MSEEQQVFPIGSGYLRKGDDEGKLSWDQSNKGVGRGFVEQLFL